MKSNVSDYLELAFTIYKDACAMCLADVSDFRDLKKIESRVKHEGFSFLTITLPAFCKGVEVSLSQGRIDPSFRHTHFRGFRFNGAIPAFLQGMLGRLFDIETGRLYDDSLLSDALSISVVSSVRQFCLAFKKLEIDCTPKRVRQAIESFVTIEQSFNEFQVPEEDLAKFRKVSSVLWDNLVFRIRDLQFVPRHGPGATAERVSGNQKYNWRIWHDRLDNYFPLFEYAYVSSALDTEEVKAITFVPEDREQPVRVTPVPKTLKGPRIIAIEPCCMQYAQQAIRDVLYEQLELDPVTRGHINFRDQSVNQDMALKSSSTGQFATIDLSDASDRVPRSLALDMFRAYPELQGAIDACRSTRAELPDGRIIGPLNKFASMGSALCFPIESMYFYTICVAALLDYQDLPITYESVFRCSRNVYIYGDDIIVPTDAASIVLEYLQKYNCKVNASKSFWSGSFRESCGVDAYKGMQVTPVYVRRERPKDMQQVSELISWSATANLFFKKGYYHTAEFMHKVCARILRYYPEVSETSSGLGRIYRLDGPPKYRRNPNTHSREVKAWVPTSVYRTDRLSGYAALQKSLLKLGSRKGATVSRNASLGGASLPPVNLVGDDPLHLERSALFRTVALKIRWVPAT